MAAAITPPSFPSFLLVKCALRGGEMFKMLTHFIFNLSSSSSSSLPPSVSSGALHRLLKGTPPPHRAASSRRLFGGNILGQSPGSCRPPRPSAAIKPEATPPRLDRQPARNRGAPRPEEEELKRWLFFNTGHHHTLSLLSPLHPSIIPLTPPPPIHHPCTRPRRFADTPSTFFRHDAYHTQGRAFGSPARGCASHVTICQPPLPPLLLLLLYPHHHHHHHHMISPNMLVSSDGRFPRVRNHRVLVLGSFTNI